MITINNRFQIILLSVASLLLIPFIAMQFTEQVNWSVLDFVVMGVLLTAVGLTIDFMLRKVNKTKHRIAFGLAILAIFFLIWAELAVGIFGTPFAGS